MRHLLAILALSLLPCSALAGEDIRIVKCTEGLYAVQEEVWAPYGHSMSGGTMEWRTIFTAPGCYPLEYARRLRDEEIAWRNRPPAPHVIEPVQVVE